MPRRAGMGPYPGLFLDDRFQSLIQSILEGTPVETGTALIVEFHTAEEIEQIRRQEELIRQQEEAMKENQVNESDENSGGEIETENAV